MSAEGEAAKAWVLAHHARACKERTNPNVDGLSCQYRAAHYGTANEIIGILKSQGLEVRKIDQESELEDLRAENAALAQANAELKQRTI